MINNHLPPGREVFQLIMYCKYGKLPYSRYFSRYCWTNKMLQKQVGMIRIEKRRHTKNSLVFVRIFLKMFLFTVFFQVWCVISTYLYRPKASNHLLRMIIEPKFCWGGDLTPQSSSENISGCLGKHQAHQLWDDQTMPKKLSFDDKLSSKGTPAQALKMLREDVRFCLLVFVGSTKSWCVIHSPLGKPFHANLERPSRN